MNWFCCEISHCYPDVFQILGSLICRHLHVVNVLGLVLKLLWSVLLSIHQSNGIVCKHLNNHCISHQLILALYKFIGVCHICQIHIGITFVYQMVHQDLLLQWRNGFRCSWWWVFETALIMWKCWNGRNEEVKLMCCVSHVDVSDIGILGVSNPCLLTCYCTKCWEKICCFCQ